MMIRRNGACVKMKASIIGTAKSASPASLPSPSTRCTHAFCVYGAGVNS